jgi:hypothetical protein
VPGDQWLSPAGIEPSVSEHAASTDSMVAKLLRPECNTRQVGACDKRAGQCGIPPHSLCVCGLVRYNSLLTECCTLYREMQVTVHCATLMRTTLTKGGP